jgi:hypothetical protein
MKKVTLDKSNLQATRDWLRRQMETQSWWPREQPRVAMEEFLHLPDTPAALQQWCEQWLYAYQWRQLEKALLRGREQR